MQSLNASGLVNKLLTLAVAQILCFFLNKFFIFIRHILFNIYFLKVHYLCLMDVLFWMIGFAFFWFYFVFVINISIWKYCWILVFDNLWLLCFILRNKCRALILLIFIQQVLLYISIVLIIDLVPPYFFSVKLRRLIVVLSIETLKWFLIENCLFSF
jgi:hypothetical protein